tara:strand:+ start:286 stop:546 length:261 start_codon:yes stop_codon:yes gene_type:complete
MDLQKIATYGSAAAVVGTGTFVGGNQALDNYKGGPERRESERIEQIRQIVAEEIYLQLKANWPESSGPVKGLKIPNKNYKNVIPQK